VAGLLLLLGPHFWVAQALIMMSAVRRSDLQPGFDMDGLQSQKRLWCVAASAVPRCGSLALLAPHVWPGC